MQGQVHSILPNLVFILPLIFLCLSFRNKRFHNIDVRQQKEPLLCMNGNETKRLYHRRQLSNILLVSTVPIGNLFEFSSIHFIALCQLVTYCSISEMTSKVVARTFLRAFSEAERGSSVRSIQISRMLHRLSIVSLQGLPLVLSTVLRTTSPTRPASGARHYARQAGPSGAYQSPMDLPQKPMTIRVASVASNVVAEPYRGPPPRLPLTAWFTPDGWKERWRRWISGAKSIYTISKCKKNIPGWSLPGFKREALDVYKQTCAALAAGDKTVLRQLASPAIFTDFKRQIKQREDGEWARVSWKLVEDIKLNAIEVVHGRLMMQNPKDDSTGFAQLTVRIPSLQVFAAYNKKGQLVSGDENEAISVVDHWVFERPLRSNYRWKVAGRLHVQQG